MNGYVTGVTVKGQHYCWTCKPAGLILFKQYIYNTSGPGIVCSKCGAALTQDESPRGFACTITTNRNRW